MTSLDDEAWLANMLGKSGSAVFEGVTTPEIRRERVRTAILAGAVQDKVAAYPKRHKPLTFAQVFHRIYGDPLVRAAERAA